MDDLSKHVFDTGLAMNRALAAHYAPLQEPVWLLWLNDSVLGVYAAVDKAVDDVMALQDASEHAYVCAGMYRWRNQVSGAILRLERRVGA